MQSSGKCAHGDCLGTESGVWPRSDARGSSESLKNQQTSGGDGCVAWELSVSKGNPARETSPAPQTTHPLIRKCQFPISQSRPFGPPADHENGDELSQEMYRLKRGGTGPVSRPINSGACSPSISLARRSPRITDCCPRLVLRSTQSRLFEPSMSTERQFSEQ